MIATLYGFAQEKIVEKSTPQWVDYQSYNIEPNIDGDDISEGSLMLLVDYQTNIPKQESYYRFVQKITENVGIQSSSNINVVYDPLYQKLVFHTITIIRGDEVIKKLNPSEFQVLRRELNAENHLYDGSLSAMTNLSDVRVNDIIDYSYSIIGFNPIHDGKYSNSFFLNDNVPMGKINIGLLSNNDLNFKLINSDVLPEISNKNGMKFYQWNIVNPVKTEYEEATPTWKISHPLLVVSDYSTWEEVVDWGVKTYRTDEKLNADLQKKIDDIDNEYSTDGEKIKAILDFVQNEIRYLGFEYGIGSYKPNSPNQVFQQRYGDCKDKSLLMVSMLNGIGVEAYPMLLNTGLKHTIKDLLPSPIFFDHCVVKVTGYEDYDFYYDPTSTNQGGTFLNTHFPNFENGLVLKPETKTMEEITSSFSNLITTNEEYILEEVGKGATYKIATTYSDVEADRMRNYFKNNSLKSINKEYENYYSNYYYNIKSKNAPTFKDDSAKNEFTIFEEYHIDSLWQPMEMKKNYISANFIPTTLLDLLYIPTKDDRNNEVEVVYPVARQHNIKIKLPQAWEVTNEKDFVSSDIFYYDWEVDYNKRQKEINIKYYLKTQKPSIEPSEFNQYKRDIDKLDQTVGYSLFIPKNGATTTPISTNIKNIPSLLIPLFFGVLFIGLIVFLLIKYTK